MPDDLHGHVVPWHPRDLGPVIHVFVRLVEVVEVKHTRVAIVLARPYIFSTVGTGFRVVYKNVLRGIPSVRLFRVTHGNKSKGLVLPSETMV